MKKTKIEKILSPKECIGKGVTKYGAKMLDSYGIQQKITRKYLKKIVSDYQNFFDPNSSMNSFEAEVTLVEIGEKVLEDLVSPETISNVEGRDEFYDKRITPEANIFAKRMCISYYIIANIQKQKLYKD